MRDDTEELADAAADALQVMNSFTRAPPPPRQGQDASWSSDYTDRGGAGEMLDHRARLLMAADTAYIGALPGSLPGALRPCGTMENSTPRVPIKAEPSKLSTVSPDIHDAATEVLRDVCIGCLHTLAVFALGAICLAAIVYMLSYLIIRALCDKAHEFGFSWLYNNLG
jgi:hypothetical protein